MSINYKTNSERTHNLIDEREVDTVESKRPAPNLSLSNDSPDEFLYAILKHYIKKNRYEKNH